MAEGDDISGGSPARTTTPRSKAAANAGLGADPRSGDDTGATRRSARGRGAPTAPAAVDPLSSIPTAGSPAASVEGLLVRPTLPPIRPAEPSPAALAAPTTPDVVAPSPAPSPATPPRGRGRRQTAPIDIGAIDDQLDAFAAVPDAASAPVGLDGPALFPDIVPPLTAPLVEPFEPAPDGSPEGSGEAGGVLTAAIAAPVATADAEPAPSGRISIIRRRRRARVRRVTRVIRHIDTWSIFKIALVFNLVLYVVCLTAGVLLWNVASTTGTIDNVQKFFEQFGWTKFEFKGGAIYHGAWIAGLFVVIGLTGFAVLLATLFNLVTDLVGGVRVTVLEEEVVARPRDLVTSSSLPTPITVRRVRRRRVTTVVTSMDESPAAGDGDDSLNPDDPAA